MSAATASAAVPAPVERSRVRVIFAGLMLVLLLAALDQTIVATALPTIVGDLGGLDRLAWVTSAFLLAQTAVTPVYGKLGDLYGQAGSPERRDPVPDRVGAVRAGDRHDRVDRLPRRAGAGRGRADRADAGGDRRRRVPPGARQVPGSFRRRLRRCQRGRTAARRRDRGGGVVAVVLLRKPARGDRLAGRPGRGAAHRPRARAAGHRLSRRRALGGRVGRDRVGHEPGRNDLGMGLGAGGPRRGAGRAPARLLPGDRAPSARAGSPPGAASRPSLRCGGGAVADRRLRLFGSVTFLPLYFQTVDAATPTEAGLRLVPMMGGVLVTSIASGQLISRTGRYRVFPIVGTAVMAIGLFLLSRLDVGTGGAASAAYLLVLGLGLGSVMQVLVLTVQNAVGYEVLGAATSGVTLFRGIGGSLGAATFGAIFTSRLTSELQGVLPGSLADEVSAGGRLTGTQLAGLPAGVQSAYEQAYVQALSPVFIAAAGVAVLGFALSWTLQERPLRETAATSTGLDDSLAAPRSPDSLAEIERALSRATTPEQRQQFRERLAARAGVELSPGVTWALVRIDEHGFARARELAEQDGVPPERIAAVVDELRQRGLVAREDLGPILTPAGHSFANRAVAARQALLTEALADDGANRDPVVSDLLRRLARELIGDRP